VRNTSSGNRETTGAENNPPNNPPKIPTCTPAATINRKTSQSSLAKKSAETQVKIREHSLVSQNTRHQNYNPYVAEEHIRNKQVLH